MLMSRLVFLSTAIVPSIATLASLNGSMRRHSVINSEQALRITGDARTGDFFRRQFSAVSHSRLPGLAWLTSRVDLAMHAQVA
jgi:hypothetical protein